jgi:hypothetical protein
MASQAAKTTLLDLLMKLQQQQRDPIRSEQALVARARRLVRSGKIVLSGIFANSRMPR